MKMFKISNVNNENKYKGAYAKIFFLLNEDKIFTEAYETENSIGLVGNDYYIEISETPDANMLEKILKIKNVTPCEK
jgi:hypothetical protein